MKLVVMAHTAAIKAMENMETPRISLHLNFPKSAWCTRMYKVTGINVANVDMPTAPTKPVNRSSLGIAAARMPARYKDSALSRKISVRRVTIRVSISVIRAN